MHSPASHDSDKVRDRNEFPGRTTRRQVVKDAQGEGAEDPVAHSFPQAWRPGKVGNPLG